MIKEVFESISAKMRNDFYKTTKLVSHPVVKGSARENALMKYLRPHIPDKYEFSEGIVIDSFDHQSKQIDIIIHRAYLRGNTSAAKWFAGPSPAENS